MINYVNTVFVGKGTNTIAKPAGNTKADIFNMLAYNPAKVGNYVIMNMSDGTYIDASTIASSDAIKIGMFTKTAANTPEGTIHVIKWSNVIKRNNIKSYHTDTYAADKSSEDTAYITCVGNTDNEHHMRILLRVTYKDMTTRFRKWTETYEYVAAPGEDASTIANGLYNVICKNYKRNRFNVEIGTVNSSNKNNPSFSKAQDDSIATAEGLKLVAMPYDDDDANDTINVANKVRFDVHMYYTVPDADGWASKNKYVYGGEVIKIDGKQYKAEGKLVRDRESWAMGYQGILNRGECTWPIVKPEMNVDIHANYDCITLEFETMYRAADDIQRHTKENIEVYDITGKMPIKTALDAWLGGIDVSNISFVTNDADDADN